MQGQNCGNAKAIIHWTRDLHSRPPTKPNQKNTVPSSLSTTASPP